MENLYQYKPVSLHLALLESDFIEKEEKTGRMYRNTNTNEYPQ